MKSNVIFSYCKFNITKEKWFKHIKCVEYYEEKLFNLSIIKKIEVEARELVYCNLELFKQSGPTYNAPHFQYNFYEKRIQYNKTYIKLYIYITFILWVIKWRSSIRKKHRDKYNERIYIGLKLISNYFFVKSPGRQLHGFCKNL